MTSSRVFSHAEGHEQVVFCQDQRTGLRAIIGIHSTTRGPALGGVRIYPYGSEGDALRDVLALSRGMSYKSALAGLDLGGGKAVIIADPSRDKTDALLRAFGKSVASLGGRYVTAPDVGSHVGDMDVISEECDYVVGRPLERGGSGDPSPMTALGVFHGMRGSADHLWGSTSLWGRRVGIEGLGKVGYFLAELLVAEGAQVVATDIDESATRRACGLGDVEIVQDAEELLRSDLDVFAPCALGGALNQRSIALLTAKIVCGAANNQLAGSGIADALRERGVLYAPDYLVNAGGLIQVADEIRGFDRGRVQAMVEGIYETVKQVYALSESEGITPAAAADRLAERRIAGARELESAVPCSAK